MKSVVWWAGGLLLAGCFVPVGEVDCTSDVDCGLAFLSCVDSRCTPSTGQADAGRTDAGRPDSGAGSFDAGSFDAGSFDAGSFDAGSFDAGSFDAGPFDAGPFDAGSFDAGSFDAGPFDAGSFDAGPPRCSTTSPCLPTGYLFDQAPECGVFCYFDEAHNVAINGPGQAQNPAGFAQFASGQLLDGVRGDADWTVNRGFEWVGWLYREANIVFQFATCHSFSVVRLGVNNRGNGAVSVPTEIRVQFADDGVNFGRAYAFRRTDGTLPFVPEGVRQDLALAVPGATGCFVRVTLTNLSAWSMVDEFEFD